MTTPADILPGHPGECRAREGWYDASIQAMAEHLVQEYAPRFARYGARMSIHPIAIRPYFWRRIFTRERYEADGLSFDVRPFDGATKPHWMWWVEAEADMALRERRGSDPEWITLYSNEEIETLLREQAETYLRQLAASEIKADAPYEEHDGTA